jgi:hypothetical protein
MKRKCLAIGISTVSVFLLILTSLSNVVGYQTVQSSNQSVIKERINQRELLFQTIVDIANNKEIQRIIIKSQMSRCILPTSDVPVLTKHQLKQMYFLGLILSKVISKSRIQSILRQYKFNNLEIQKEINTIIENDKTLNTEITQLKDSECDCENDNMIEWRFPVICLLLYPIVICVLMICGLFLGGFSLGILWGIGLILQCFWWNP